ncbi:MAG: hypothetical protein QMD23_08565, partial [Candidatus Bathyarchaeia archaeon]|nr:hypothetical protein [Candidatus Bathyarchaeia archaeon]
MEEKKKVVSVILAMILVIPYLSSFAWFAQGAPSVTESSESVQGFLNNRLPYIDPDLTSIKEPTRVILIAGEEANFSQIATHMVSCRVTPSFGGLRLIFGTVDADNVKFLASSKALFAILKDREVGLMNSPRSILSQGNFLKDTKSLQPDVDVPEELPSGANSPEATMREVVKIMNATGVWDEYGVTGDNVTIAIVDTGVDYGSLGLGYWDV